MIASVESSILGPRLVITNSARVVMSVYLCEKISRLIDYDLLQYPDNIIPSCVGKLQISPTPTHTSSIYLAYVGKLCNDVIYRCDNTELVSFSIHLYNTLGSLDNFYISSTHPTSAA
jgi:hypothetical protein